MSPKTATKIIRLILRPAENSLLRSGFVGIALLLAAFALILHFWWVAGFHWFGTLFINILIGVVTVGLYRFLYKVLLSGLEEQAAAQAAQSFDNRFPLGSGERLTALDALAVLANADNKDFHPSAVSVLEHFDMEAEMALPAGEVVQPNEIAAPVVKESPKKTGQPAKKPAVKTDYIPLEPMGKTLPSGPKPGTGNGKQLPLEPRMHSDHSLSTKNENG